MECLLCCEEEPFVGLGKCNHQPICYKCSYKMHVVTKDSSCPICKEHLDTLIIVPITHKPFADLRKAPLLDSKAFPNILFCNKEAKTAFEKLSEYRCFVPKCDQAKGLPTIAFLKKHLKEKHNRFLCDICVENKRCVLEDHKFYSFKALESHQKSGDFDEMGNLIFLHPFCSFCKEYFFDEEGLRKHLGREHFCCNTCPDTYKYTFYKDYKSLETHFKMTHHLCLDPDCISKGFIVFKNNADLMAHRYMEHDKNTGEKRAKDLTAISGFYTEGTKHDEAKIKFHDKEGINFEDEFLSLKKIKLKGVHQVDQQQDGQFDFRLFCSRDVEEDELLDLAFEGGVRKDKGAKKQYREKGDRQKTDKKKEQPEDDKPEGQLMMEDLLLIKTIHMPAIEASEFDKKISGLFSQGNYDKFSELKHNFNKKKLGAKEFLEGFLKLFSSKRTAYNVWPQYIRTVQNQATREELDEVYLKSLKTLTKRVPTMANTASRYSDFMSCLLSEIEINMESRIVEGPMNIKKGVRIDRTRIYQIIQILRHMSSIDMIRLKHSANLGILPDTANFIQRKVFMGKRDQVQQELSSIPEPEFLCLYLYARVCRDALSGKKIHLEIKFIKEEILEEFLEQRPHLLLKYAKRKESMTLDQQAAYEDKQENKKLEKLHQQTFTNKHVLIDNSDKYQFPDLVENKKEEEKKYDPKANITNEEYRQTIVYQTKKPATRLKNLTEYFPSIGQVKNETHDSTSEKKQEQKMTTKVEQTPWWQKVSGKAEQKAQPVLRVAEMGRKKKRGREVIEIQGGFK